MTQKAKRKLTNQEILELAKLASEENEDGINLNQIAHSLSFSPAERLSYSFHMAPSRKAD